MAKPLVIAISSGGKVETLTKEVLEVHDKTMKQMGTMAKLRTRLKEEWKTANDTAAYYNAYEDLKQANEDMMDWMRNFKDPEEQDWPEEQKVEYLQEQKQKIDGVEEYIESSIEKAQKVLSKK